MNKIELTADEIKAIEQQLNGEIEVWHATDTQQRLISGIVKKAEKLINEENAIDELDDHNFSLIQWYYDRFKSQK